MTSTHKWLMASAIAMAFSLAACGEGGGSSVVISTPPPPPVTVTIPPPPSQAAALLAPVRTASPASPVASAGGPSFSNPSGDTVFPLLITAVTGDFGGDAVTTNQGATLRLEASSGRQTLTVNNPLLGPTTMKGDFLLSNGEGLYGYWYLENLDYTLYGSWYVGDDPWGYSGLTGRAVFVGGYVTSTANIPTAGTAVYNGSVSGNYSNTSQGTYFDVQFVNGDVRLSADFGARTISGAMTNMRVNLPSGSNPLNDIGFTANLDPSRNLFQGTTQVTSVPAGGAAFKANATGLISGIFFGPVANEVGAVWTLSDDQRRIIGTFAGRP